MKVLRRLWPVVLVLAACGSVTPSFDGAGAGGTTGAAGATAGTSAAGTKGAAGSMAGSTGGSIAGTTGHAGTSGAAGSGNTCTPACGTARTCCSGGCVNLVNDPMNCGACGRHCDGATTLCSGGACVAPMCGPTVRCAAVASCCGTGCCQAGDLCCQPDGPVSGGPPVCYTPTKDQPTCPQGCAPLCVSDRNLKKNIAPADTAAILDKVSRLPIATWTYRTERDGIRHLGPMAQDFRAGFGLGDDDHTYFAVDAQGVALAAIQALDRVVAEQQKRLDKLESENRELARRLPKQRLSEQGAAPTR